MDDEAFMDGHKAYFSGVAEAANPHKAGSHAASEWMTGFYAAQLKHDDEEQAQA